MSESNYFSVLAQVLTFLYLPFGDSSMMAFVVFMRFSPTQQQRTTQSADGPNRNTGSSTAPNESPPTPLLLLRLPRGTQRAAVSYPSSTHRDPTLS